MMNNTEVEALELILERLRVGNLTKEEILLLESVVKVQKLNLGVKELSYQSKVGWGLDS